MSANLIGAGPSYVGTDALFPLGTVEVFGHDACTYVQAASTLAADAVTSLTAGYATTAGTGYTTLAAIPSGSYGWVKKTTSPF